MLTKAEILKLVGKVNVSPETMEFVEMILRNFSENDLISSEKLEVICQLIIKN
jgi:hypothetical protein